MKNNLTIKVGTQTSGVKTGLRTLMGQLQGMRAAVQNIGKGWGSALVSGIAAVGVASAVRRAFDRAGALDDTANSLGLDVEQLQGLRGAFGEAGTSAQKFDASLAKLVQRIEDAKGGNEAALEQFDALGVKLEDLESLNTGDVLLKMADGFQAAGGSGRAFSAVVDILGKGGVTMAGGMKEGAAGIREVADAFDKLTAGEIAGLGAIEDAVGRVGTKLNNLVIEGVGGLFGGWDVLVEKMRATGKEADKLNGKPGFWARLGNALPQTGYMKAFSAATAARTAPKLTKDDAGEQAKQRAQIEQEMKLMEQLRAAREDRADLDRSDPDRMTALLERQAEIEAKIAAEKEGSVSALALQVQWEKNALAIDQLRLKMVDDEVAVMIRNAELRGEIADIQQQTADAEKKAMMEALPHAERMARLQAEIARNADEARDSDELRAAILFNQNSELLDQVKNIRDLQIEEAKRALADAVIEKLKTPQQRRADAQEEKKRERAERAVLARERDRKANLDRNAKKLAPSEIPRLLRRDENIPAIKVRDDADIHRGLEAQFAKAMRTLGSKGVLDEIKNNLEFPR